MSEDRTFEYLMNAMEDAARAKHPAERGYADKRARVFQFVADLQSDYLRRHRNAVDLLDTLLTMKLRCGYIINHCRTLEQAHGEANEMLRVIAKALAPSSDGDPQP